MPPKHTLIVTDEQTHVLLSLIEEWTESIDGKLGGGPVDLSTVESLLTDILAEAVAQTALLTDIWTRIDDATAPLPASLTTPDLIRARLLAPGAPYTVI